jgi:hypothetical protein
MRLSNTLVESFIALQTVVTVLRLLEAVSSPPAQAGITMPYG